MPGYIGICYKIVCFSVTIKRKLEVDMLELKDVRKTYHVGDIETKALDGISVAFREREFVAILGTSG